MLQRLHPFTMTRTGSKRRFLQDRDVAFRNRLVKETSLCFTRFRMPLTSSPKMRSYMTLHLSGCASSAWISSSIVLLPLLHRAES